MWKSKAIELARSIPLTSGLSSSLKTQRAPNAPSMWNHIFSAVQNEASASKSSIAPVLTVPAVPITQKAAAAIIGNAVLQRSQIDAKPFVGRNPAEMIATEAQDFHCLDDTFMDLG